MKSSPVPSSFTWGLRITIFCSLVSNAVPQIIETGVFKTNTSDYQYQCVVWTAPDLGDGDRGLQVVNPSKGIVHGSFFLHPNSEEYNIILSWNKDTPKEKCTRDNHDFNTYLDLKLNTSKCRQIIDKRCNEGYCSKVAEIHFRYITTGCYSFEVNLGRDIIHESYKFMRTDFLSSKFKKLSCGGAIQRKMFNLSLRAEIENLVFDDTARLKVCYFESHNESRCENMFYISINESKPTNNGQRSNHEYYVGRNHLFLRLVNISQKVSRIFLNLENDIRCLNPANEFYHEFCQLVINLDNNCTNLKNFSSSDFEEIQNNMYGVLLPLLVLPLILISSLAIAKRFLIKNPQIDYKVADLNTKDGSEKYIYPVDIMNIKIEAISYPDKIEKRDLVGRKGVNKIILAYSQDCPEFMEVMEALRIYLHDVMSFEVYDCFDPDLFTSITPDKYAWIDSQIRRQDTGIILVETPLAVIINHIIKTSKVNVKYMNPTMFSDLFIYIMKQIRNPTISSYDKIAVIRFEEYTDEKLALLDNNCVRFTIPASLKDLFHHFTGIHEPPVCFDACIQMNNLKSCLDKLRNFRARNADHPQNIIDYSKV